MKQRTKFIIIGIIVFLLISMFAVLIGNGNMQLLNPKGYIAQKQSILLFTALLAALFIGVPVVITTFFIVFRYSDGKKERVYAPTWKAPKKLIAAWWIFPAILMYYWAIVGWNAVHLLDPYRPLNTSVPPITIQVVALQWKWLFIYPQEHIATINDIAFPVDTPVNFQLTADAPMNSFWIPSLGGQIYAMTGMETQLHLIANSVGTYPGSGAEMSGDGFSGMNFTVHAVSMNDYENWVQQAKNTKSLLTDTTYTALAKPSSYVKQTFYTISDQNLFNKIMLKYMYPNGQTYITNTNL